MKVRILGTAAGGGYPQWNCACARCAWARSTGVSRLQDTVAVSVRDREWWLLNASPDLRAQISGCADLLPREGRATPIRGVVLTTAELDHTLGLPMLREAAELRVVAHPAVLGALDGLRQVLRPYTAVSWCGTGPEQELVLEPGLTLRLLVVGDKPPRYASGPGPGWVSAVRLTDAVTGGSLVYAPCLPRWTARFAAFAAGASAVLLDGTFCTDDEMTVVAGRGRSARAMGHLPIVDSLSHLSTSGGGVVRYTHLNNTNPLLDPASAERELLRAAGVAAAEDGEVLVV